MLVREYIFLAGGCVSLGVIITFIVLVLCPRLGFNIDEHGWVLALPAVLSIVLNIIFIELYRKLRNKP